MGFRPDHALAERIVRTAFYDAQTDLIDPDWEELVREVWNYKTKTYVPALGTAMLAKILNPRADVFSIKVTDDPRSFSLRNLCHQTLVPLAVELGFSIRNTGREPINNQPWFRYNNVLEFERVRQQDEFDSYSAILGKLSGSSPDEARRAFIAYMAVAQTAFARIQEVVAVGGVADAAAFVEAVDELLEIPGFGPYLTQSLGAVIMQSFYPTIISRRLNDPSRDLPGDVQALDEDGHVVASLEARFKAVSEQDVKTFVASCGRVNIPRAIILALGHPISTSETLYEWAWVKQDVVLAVFSSVQEAVFTMLAWSPEPPHQALTHLAVDLVEALIKIGAPEVGIARANDLLASPGR